MTFPMYVWKKAPFLRLVVPFIIGIATQWYLPPAPLFDGVLLIAGIILLIIVNLQRFYFLFRYSWLNGIAINILFFSAGALICYCKDGTHDANAISQHYRSHSLIVAAIDEPLSEKPKSFKTTAVVKEIICNDTVYKTSEHIIIYFKKDSVSKTLQYGNTIAFEGSLQSIKSNPNSEFNYQRYAAFHGMYYQAYLQPKHFVVLPQTYKNRLTSFLILVQQKIVRILSAYIPGEKEHGLAEALLIGYKDDLDTSLVQSYSNTGVVHIIAISGLHLGLIYWLLNLLLQPLQKRKQTKWLKSLLIIAGLWLFSLLAGGGPSILRSAVMFTCLVVGESMSRKASVYNTIAVSAFILLCIHPFWLWDVGFQLSYTALLSIVIFSKPIYNCIYVQNKLLDHLWQLNSVTLAAQILTVPISIYQFHQFPTWFIFTNMVTVPLSSLIVLAEIFLCAIAFISPLAKFIGIATAKLIQLMNGFVEYTERLPFSIIPGLQLNTMQLVLMYGLVAALAYWLFYKSKPGLITAMVCLLGMVTIRTYFLVST